MHIALDEPSAAGDAHMPVHAWAVMAAIDDKIMPLRLEANGTIDCRIEKRIIV